MIHLLSQRKKNQVFMKLKAIKDDIRRINENYIDFNYSNNVVHIFVW